MGRQSFAKEDSLGRGAAKEGKAFSVLDGEWKDPATFADERERFLPADMLRTSKRSPRPLPVET
jgi:hypothetical protein